MKAVFSILFLSRFLFLPFINFTLTLDRLLTMNLWQISNATCFICVNKIQSLILNSLFLCWNFGPATSCNIFRYTQYILIIRLYFDIIETHRIYSVIDKYLLNRIYGTFDCIWWSKVSIFNEVWLWKLRHFSRTF